MHLTTRVYGRYMTLIGVHEMHLLVYTHTSNQQIGDNEHHTILFHRGLFRVVHALRPLCTVCKLLFHVQCLKYGRAILCTSLNEEPLVQNPLRC